MKIAAFKHRAKSGLGLVLEKENVLIDLQDASRRFCRKGSTNYVPRTAFRTLDRFISYGEKALNIAHKVLEAAEEGAFKKYRYPLEEVKLLPPIQNPSKIVCAALTYEVYRQQIGFEYLEVPMIFLKAPSCIIGHMDPIKIPLNYGAVYHEWELACIIGRTCRNVSEDEVEQYIFGYTIFNDITGHDVEMKSILLQQLGKNIDTFAPIGPYVVTPDQIKDVQNLRMVRRRNGVVEAEGNTSQMRFKVNEIVSYISTFMTLNPGDIVSTGSPPAGPIEPGDVIEAEIEGIGVLKNPVVGVKIRTDYAKKIGLLE